MKFAILTPIGPGRDWLLDSVWPQALEAAGCPKSETRLCVVNNSGTHSVRRKVAGIASAMGWAEWRIADNREQGSGLHERREGLSSHMADNYARLLAMAGDAEFSLTLETDITLPGRGELGGLCAFDHMMDGMAEDVAMVGTPVCSRHQRETKVSVYRVSHTKRWPKDKTRPPVRETGFEEVHAFGHSCVLMRTAPVREAGFSATPNVDGSGGPGHEWGNQKRLMRAGWRLLVDWGVKPLHWKSPTEWVKA